MATAPIEGTELYYEEAGSGEPCLVMHGGLGLDLTYMKGLAPLEDELRMIYYDHRGNGRSGRPPLDTITMPQLAADADALREHLALDAVAVLGHSYGGFVALEYAATYPDRVTRLILVSTTPGSFEPSEDELAARADPSWIGPEVHEAAAQVAKTPDDPADLPDWWARIAPVYVKSISAETLATAMRDPDAVYDLDTMARSMQALQGWSVESRLDAIRAPTLVACGRYDLVTTPEGSVRLAARIPGAELAFFERSGHFPWLEEPDVFFQAVRAWLARQR